MSHRALQNLVGRAIVDRDFRDQLLNGNREQVMADFNLADDEVSAISSIEAHSLEAFASELDDWLEDHDGKSRRRRVSLF
ncbi:MAG: Os1348 family NHLP clan protein [Anaerolineae bacterium]